MTDYRKYDWMENRLQEINRKHISLEKWEIKRNNVIFHEVRTTIIEKLKCYSTLLDALFGEMFFGGSYYDGLKVGQPDEYDLDLPLWFNKTLKYNLINDNLEPGFVKVILKENYKGLEEWYDEYQQLDTIRVLRWLQKIVDKALKCYIIDKEFLITSCGPFRVTKSIGFNSPACAFKLKGIEEPIQMDIDLVPCFVFQEEHWPNGFKMKYNIGKKGTFFIVPKHPRGYGKSHYWRLSFQKQERDLMEGKERLKSALKLMKKLRDTQGQYIISSYFLKTILLLEIEQYPESYWRNKSLSYCFMKLLEAYRDRLGQRRIPYFWNEKFNLIEPYDYNTLTNFYNRIKYIINDIDRNPLNVNVLEKHIIGNNGRLSHFSPIIQQSSAIDEHQPHQRTSNDQNSTIKDLAIGLGVLSLGVIGATLYRYCNSKRNGNN